MIEALRDGRWCTTARLRHYPLILLALLTVGLVGLVATSDGTMDVMRRPLGTDFSQVWTAGVEVREGRPTAPFDPPTHAARQQQLFGADTPFYGWHYPPYFLIVATLLAALPYLAALAVWQASTFALYLAAVLAILRGVGRGVTRRDVIVAATAFPAVFVNLTHGHNGFLTAALISAGLLLLRRQPLLAGMVFACLAYKPQFALVVPVALVAEGCWTAIAAGAATLGLLTLLTTWLFGPAVWLAFQNSLAFTRTVVLEQGDTGWPKIQSLFSATRMLGGGIDLAYAVQTIGTVLVLAIIAFAWRSRADLRLKAALLCIATLLTTPYCLDYDLMILGPGLSFAVGYGLEHGFAPWERTIFAATWVMPLLARPLAAATHIPVGPLMLVVVFAIVTRRTAWDGGLDPRRWLRALRRPAVLQQIDPEPTS